MSIATANAIRPRSSAAAKPLYKRPCWPSDAAGLRMALWRNEPNTKPTPTEAAPTPMAARPAPISFAEARSMIELLWKICGLVKVDGFADVQRGEDCKDVRLDRRDK